MTRRHADLLDTTARWIAAAEPVTSRESDRLPPSSDEHFSRATAIRYGAAAVASLTLGLWRAPAGQALDEAGCYSQCADRRIRDAEAAMAACRRLYSPGWYSKPGTDSRWGAFKELMKSGGPWEWATAYANQVLLRACLDRAKSTLVKGLDDCEDACRIACEESSRSPQGRSSRHQVCKPPPSPKPESPKPPPGPNHTESPCWACEEAGGLCCGPFTGDPNTGEFTPCACANPAVGCQAYGCGG